MLCKIICQLQNYFTYDYNIVAFNIKEAQKNIGCKVKGVTWGISFLHPASILLTDISSHFPAWKLSLV